ncbi:MAG: glycosyltransferase family 2 protein [Steroidobacteraceae bacterium]
MEISFWVLLGLAFYVYAGYPLLLAFIGLWRRKRRDSEGGSEHSVTLIISAYNEERVIADKIRNSLALDYPRGLLEIVVVSDASSDRTDEIVAGFADGQVKLLRMAQRGGKTLGLNEASHRARGDVVIFSDANAMYRPDVIRALLSRFTDERVGGVIGQSCYYTGELESERSEGLYWRYESTIKRLESHVGSVVGGDGAIYAIRRALYVPMAADSLSDFMNPLQIVKAGHRVVYEPTARSFEHAGQSFQKEFRRKVRIVNRAWRATLRMRALLNPLRFGFFAVELWSHKVFRWLMPLVMLGLLASNLWLAPAHPLYAVLLGLQALFYLCALIGWALRARPRQPALFSVPYYFCLVNVASLMGIIDAFRGRTYATWSTVRT